MRKALEQLASKPEKLVIGLMSGTSMDGIDAALTRIIGNGLATQVELVKFVSVPYSQRVRSVIDEQLNPETSRVDVLCSLNFELGHLFAEAVGRLLQEAEIDPKEIDLIGSHGQTVYHIPVTDPNQRLRPSTLQIGESAVIAERWGCPVISDFRVRDMAAGGQGAPLVCLSEYLLYRSSEHNIVLQNIGGIGNVTVLPRNGSLKQISAFDTGPGNSLIDAAVQLLTEGRESMDFDGRHASSGRVSHEAIQRLLANPYFAQGPPKSTGRERFGLPFAKQVVHELQSDGLGMQDILATLTAFTAASIRDQYERFVYPSVIPDRVIVGGGGSYNRFLLRCLSEELSPIPVLTQEQLGYSSDAKEAVAFAVLANETIMGSPGNVPSATGAFHPVVLGKMSI